MKKKILAFFLCIFLIFIFRSYNETQFSKFPFSRENHVKIINFQDKLSSDELYNSIFCRKSKYFHCKTTICVHNVSEDRSVSGSIISKGVWEEHIIKKFTDYVYENPDWLVFDIGANIGQYTMFALKLGRNVIAIEPFYENILRIQKAVRIENLENKLILIQNALSDKPNEIKRLRRIKGSIGAQGLFHFKNITFSKENMKNDKFLVETVTFDDVLEKIWDKKFQKVIMKIDIEGFEPFAFKRASKFFEIYQIQIIFMEWAYIVQKKKNYQQLIEDMITLFSKNNLQPFDFDKKLDLKNWQSWPGDVFWKRIDL